MPGWPARLLFLTLVISCSGRMTAERLLGAPVAPVLPAAHSPTQNAGYIFSGTVKAVERVGPTNAASVPVMRITFLVESGIRGVRNGQTLTIREWAGLWDAGERYRPGERVMLFLYPPSKLGLTSPVGGSRGRFVVGTNGRIILSPRRLPSGPDPSNSDSRPVEMTPRQLVRELQRVRGD